jgi:hypothetical protein
VNYFGPDHEPISGCVVSPRFASDYQMRLNEFG